MSKRRNYNDEEIHGGLGNIEDRNQESIEKENIDFPDMQEETVPKTVNGTVCNASLVNIRRGPSKEYDPITTIKEGSKVEILEEVGDFYKIKYERNKKGYISSDFCKKEG